MGKYRRRPGEIEAVQFTGENWVEMVTFTGTRKAEDGRQVMVFNPRGTFLLSFFANTESAGAEAELWVAAKGANVYIHRGEWVLKDEKGFYPCKDDEFKKLYEEAA